MTFEEHLSSASGKNQNCQISLRSFVARSIQPVILDKIPTNTVQFDQGRLEKWLWLVRIGG